MKGLRMSKINYKETNYGFEYGAAEVSRLFSDKKKQWVTISVKTPKHSLQIYVTKTGKVRVHDERGEWKAERGRA